jgi:membrane protein YqaA with SNARE-associated domain
VKTLKHILGRYSAFLWAAIKPLGIWGVFTVAALDGAAFGLPLDFVVAAYVAQNHRLLLVYVLMASAGSALGSLVIYAIGYKGGEEFLRKRVSPERFERMHSAFDKHPFWSLMFPAMLPPPTPFKLFAIAAAVTEMSLSHFVLAIFFGRTVRFLLLGILVVKFGPQIVSTLAAVFAPHFYWVIIAGGAALVVWLTLRRARRNSKT